MLGVIHAQLEVRVAAWQWWQADTLFSQSSSKQHCACNLAITFVEQAAEEMTLPPAFIASCAVVRREALWRKLLNDIPDYLLSPKQKTDAKAAFAVHMRTAEERLGVFCGGHTSAVQRFRRLISLRSMLPGVKLTRGHGGTGKGRG